MTLELSDEIPEYGPPDSFGDADPYEEPCDECGGKVWVTGGHSYYNGSYQCYTLYLHCENCGPYEVECV